MSIQEYPCVDCEACLPIGQEMGICQVAEEKGKEKMVDIYDVDPDCPKEKGGNENAPKRTGPPPDNEILTFKSWDVEKNILPQATITKRKGPISISGDGTIKKDNERGKKEDILKKPPPFPTFELNYLDSGRMKRIIYPTLKIAITKALLMIQGGWTYPIAIFNTLTREWPWEIRIAAEKSLIKRFNEIEQEEK